MFGLFLCRSKKIYLQNGAFRIMTPQGVCKKTLSTNVGAFFTDYIDIHDLNDYKKAKKKIEKN